MKYYDWNPAKNERLKTEREVGFEDVIIAIDEARLIDILTHYNPKRYPDQKIFVVVIAEYVYLVPYVEDEEKIFFKTIIPSRKATQKYLLKIKKRAAL